MFTNCSHFSLLFYTCRYFLSRIKPTGTLEKIKCFCWPVARDGLMHFPEKLGGRIAQKTAIARWRFVDGAASAPEVHIDQFYAFCFAEVAAILLFRGIVPVLVYAEVCHRVPAAILIGCT